ncbi:MAG TPA: purine-nucleoside phosphorylase [Cyclobacteriaceae bacterium]|nr:purine-nucleoside phosphorylase [Cyclobacteriaceae bacterium]HRJ80711.1 purine-nucleoside phosphorylase [Cyclobacteriaceae bacterium]
MMHEIKEATDFLLKRGVVSPEVGVILGTGLGNLFVKEIKSPLVINYNSIPFFPISTVEYHKGQLIYGEVKGKKVLAMQGRFHYYEGYSLQQITLPVRVMKLLGIKNLLISNAAGNLNPKWKKGQLMLIDDHINLIPDNPLRGENYELFGPRFPDMSEPYSKALNKKLKQIAKAKKIRLNEGVYIPVMGPNLETRAEYRFLRKIGGDAVGMSTAPEVIVANHMGLPCCAISVLTDDCEPDDLKPVNLTEIVKVAGKAEPKLTELYVELINEL